jgi:hypothetical protein
MFICLYLARFEWNSTIVFQSKAIKNSSELLMENEQEQEDVDHNGSLMNTVHPTTTSDISNTPMDNGHVHEEMKLAPPSFDSARPMLWPATKKGLPWSNAGEKTMEWMTVSSFGSRAGISTKPPAEAIFSVDRSSRSRFPLGS